LSTLQDDARLECITDGSRVKLTGEQSRGAGLLSSAQERPDEKEMVSGLVWLRVCEGLKALLFGPTGPGEVLARLDAWGTALEGMMAWSWLRILGRRRGP
jgi:hypothetical protein